MPAATNAQAIRKHRLEVMTLPAWHSRTRSVVRPIVRGRRHCLSRVVRRYVARATRSAPTDRVARRRGCWSAYQGAGLCPISSATFRSIRRVIAFARDLFVSSSRVRPVSSKPTAATRPRPPSRAHQRRREGPRSGPQPATRRQTLSHAMRFVSEALQAGTVISGDPMVSPKRRDRTTPQIQTSLSRSPRSRRNRLVSRLNVGDLI